MEISKNNMIIILDGLGIGKEYEGNAFYLANTPNLDRLKKEVPYTEITASGEGVGLPEGQMGNSEVGHLNIGSGRVVYQNLLRINNAVKEKSMEYFPVFEELYEDIKTNNKSLHLIGLLSDGGVHSHELHLYELIRIAKAMGVEQVYVHAILDGRDVSPNAGLGSISRLEKYMSEIGIGEIASVSGRYYAMDRDKNWARTERAYKVIVDGEGDSTASIYKYVEASYAKDITDEFIEPIKSPTFKGIEDGDGVIFYNFRPDRARQLTHAIVDEDFAGFERKKYVKTNFVSMTEYEKNLTNVKVAFAEIPPINTLGEFISFQGLKQLRIAETEKYAHVTFFFNGGVEKEFEGEDRILVPSPKVATFDLQPEMNAEEVANRVIAEIDKEKYELIVLNFANCDMVGHTGYIPAAIKAVETVDRNLGRVLEKLKEKNGAALITADHGNCEVMLDNGLVVTSHTTNPVPLFCYNYKEDISLKSGGKLSDLAPTIIDMMGLKQPEEMTGISLLKRRNNE